MSCSSRERFLEYDDVFILPEYSDVVSRSEVSTAVILESRDSKQTYSMAIPVISSNMDTITEEIMSAVLTEAGAGSAIHRFSDISVNVYQYKQTMLNTEGKRSTSGPFVSIGTNRDWKERALALYDAGARYFVVDVAHGHSKMMRDTLAWLRYSFGSEIFIMAGNVGTPEAVADLDCWGADAIKVGIGGGFVCETKNITGVNTPMFTTVMKCAAATDKPVIADGGARAYGDVAKALGAGASAVMSGYFFAGCPETPARARVYNSETHVYQPIYRGMASRGAMEVIRSNDDKLPTAEGRSTTTSPKPSAKIVVEEIAGGLRSAFSYVGARSVAEFQHKVKFGYRR